MEELCDVVKSTVGERLHHGITSVSYRQLTVRQSKTSKDARTNRLECPNEHARPGKIVSSFGGLFRKVHLKYHYHIVVDVERDVAGWELHLNTPMIYVGSQWGSCEMSISDVPEFPQCDEQRSTTPGWGRPGRPGPPKKGGPISASSVSLIFTICGRVRRGFGAAAAAKGDYVCMRRGRGGNFPVRK